MAAPHREDSTIDIVGRLGELSLRTHPPDVLTAYQRRRYSELLRTSAIYSYSFEVGRFGLRLKFRNGSRIQFRRRLLSVVLQLVTSVEGQTNHFVRFNRRAIQNLDQTLPPGQ